MADFHDYHGRYTVGVVERHVAELMNILKANLALEYYKGKTNDAKLIKELESYRRFLKTLK